MILSCVICAFYFVLKVQNAEGRTNSKFNMVFLPNSSQRDPSLGANCRDFLQSCNTVVNRGFCALTFYQRYCCQTCSLAVSTTELTTERTTTRIQVGHNPLFLPDGSTNTHSTDPKAPKPGRPLLLPSGRSMLPIGFGPSNKGNDGKSSSETGGSPNSNRQTLFLPGGDDEDEVSPNSKLTTTQKLPSSTTTKKTPSTSLPLSETTKAQGSGPKACLTPSGDDGTCKLLKQCPPIIEAITKGQEYKLCGFSGADPIACCPPFDKYYNVPGCGERKLLGQEADEDLKMEKMSSIEGEEEEEDNQDPRILGGTISKTNSWPWMAILAYKSSGSSLSTFCSGVIISERFVLTAGHCLQDGEPFVVIMGEHDYLRTNESFSSEDYEVEEILFYPGYNAHQGYHDLALVKLSKDVDINRAHIRAVCLPWGEFSSKSLIGKSSIITGWGVIQYGGRPSSVLREVLVRIFSAEKCSNSYSTLDDFHSVWPKGMTENDIICAGTQLGGKDACQGDSGGPLMTEDYRSVYTLMAIVSKGYGCGQANYPGIYAPLPNKDHLDWIKQKVFRNSNIGNKIL